MDGDGGLEVEFKFVESCCEAAELLEVSEGSFDSVGLSIKGTVEATLDFAQRTWRDDSGDSVLEMVQDGIGVVARVGEHGPGAAGHRADDSPVPGATSTASGLATT
jgi:hypothetical protein